MGDLKPQSNQTSWLVKLALVLLPAIAITAWVIVTRYFMGYKLPLPFSSSHVVLIRPFIDHNFLYKTELWVALACPLLVVFNPWVRRQSSKIERLLLYVFGYGIWLVLVIWLAFCILAGVFGLAF